MSIEGLDHFTLRCRPGELPALRRFYIDVLGLSEGRRAEFDFPGHWLYANDQALVHLAADDGGAELAGMPCRTGRLDHISFRTCGLAAFRERLRRQAVDFRELPVPGLPLHQLFLTDPTGLKIELTFHTEQESPGSDP